MATQRFASGRGRSRLYITQPMTTHCEVSPPSAVLSLVSLPGQRRLVPLTLTALGVVYGDIGTSPLYAMRECFFGSHSVPPTQDNVLGVLSLIIYSLLLVISVKYIAIVMRADNHGEGGILALTALLPGTATSGARTSGARAARASSARRCSTATA